jgi:hypothetical protein
MANKRMFDIEIIKTDKFIDLPAESKALYFILGLEADDEGFVNPKIAMRVHLISTDALKVLIAKQLVIPFKSGVVVITDWHRNNWLDSRRIKPTQFTYEKSTITLDSESRYLLSNGLANVKQPLSQSRVEESSIEENRIISSPKPKVSESFNEFYSNYPKKVGKLAAMKAYEKALKLVDATTLLHAAIQYSQATRGKDPKFIPHPATWLNQGRWDDEQVKTHGNIAII